MRNAPQSIAWVLLAAFAVVLPVTARAEEGSAPSDALSANPSEGSIPSDSQGPQARQGKEPTPEEMQRMMGAMLTPMADMMGLMLEGMAKTAAKREIAEYFATFTRNYYDALIARGFTEEQALKIVTSSGLPSVGGKQ